MQKEKFKTIITWTVTALYMVLIFWLSSRTSTESSQQSGVILEWLIQHFGDNFFTDFIVRKSAHFLEFAGLGFLFNISFYQTKKRRMPIISVSSASIYALSDEIHQLFVDGRSCQLSDWLLDSCGALFGTAAFLVMYAVINALIKRKNTIDRKHN